MEDVVKKFVIVVAAGLMMVGVGSWVAGAQTVRTEEATHPRIASAIRESRRSH
jgi:hypothetical protein